MWWFKSRPKQRKIVKQQRRLGVEQLEQRLPPGSWGPGPGIDITGVVPIGDLFVVAGQFVEFTIVGSGEDLDLKSQEAQTQGASGGMSEPDQVTFTWWGAPCIVSADGKSASCQIGTAGSGSIVNVYVDADDAAVVPAGDDGSRDDPKVHVGTQVYGIWVDISLSSFGPMQGVYPNGGFSGFADDELGTATSIDYGDGQGPVAGLWSKVELTGHIFHPTVPDGTGRFDWRQEADARLCFLRKDGSIGNSASFRFENAESPLDQFQTHETVNSKVYMIDAPGGKEISGTDYEEIIIYKSFTTWVNFNTVKASFNYEWHTTTTLRNDGTDWMYNHTANHVGAGHDPNRPAAVTAPNPLGQFDVNCSTQTW